MTAPNGQAQQAVVRAALKSGRVGPEEISYVEAHGTGTSIGDPIELEALAEVLGAPAGGRPCHIGAVKSNIGHLEAAAGIAGLIKTVLALQHDLIPANLHFTALNPLVSLDGTRLKIRDESRALDVGRRPAARRRERLRIQRHERARDLGGSAEAAGVLYHPAVIVDLRAAAVGPFA